MLHLVKDHLEEYDRLVTPFAKCHSALVDELSTQNSKEVNTTIDNESNHCEERLNSANSVSDNCDELDHMI